MNAGLTFTEFYAGDPQQTQPASPDSLQDARNTAFGGRPEVQVAAGGFGGRTGGGLGSGGFGGPVEGGIMGSVTGGDDGNNSQQPEVDIAARAQEERKKYEVLSDAELLKLIKDKPASDKSNLPVLKGAYEELIRRHDLKFQKEDYAKQMPQMIFISEALKTGRGIQKRQGGGFELSSDRQLTEQERWALHRAMIQTIEVMHNPIAIRQEYAKILKDAKLYADATRVAEAANEKSEVWMQPLAGGAKPIDMIMEEANRLREDQRIVRSADILTEMEKVRLLFTGGTNADTGIIKTPINTNKFLTFLYLGTEVAEKRNDRGEVTGFDVNFGTNASFKPNLAIGSTAKARAYMKYILNFDPADPRAADISPAYPSILGEDYKLVPNASYNMFLDANHNGKPDMLDASTPSSLRTSLRSSNALSAAIYEGLAGMASRAFTTPGRASTTPSRGSGYATASGTTLPERDYDFDLLPGTVVDAKLPPDNNVHVGGSLLAAAIQSQARDALNTNDVRFALDDAWDAVPKLRLRWDNWNDRLISASPAAMFSILDNSQNYYQAQQQAFRTLGRAISTINSLW